MNDSPTSNECVHPWVSIVLSPRTHCAACGFNFATPPEIDNLTRDRDEWREQHERLVAVREQDLKVMQARIDAMMTGGKYQTGTDEFRRMWAVLDELDKLRAADEARVHRGAAYCERLTANPGLSTAQHRVLSLVSNGRSATFGTSDPNAFVGRMRTIRSLRERGMLDGYELTDKGRNALAYYSDRSISP